MDLLVVRAFGTYKAGDRVTDPAMIKVILATEHATRVVRVAAIVAPVVSANLKKGE